MVSQQDLTLVVNLRNNGEKNSQSKLTKKCQHSNFALLFKIFTYNCSSFPSKTCWDTMYLAENLPDIVW